MSKANRFWPIFSGCYVFSLDSAELVAGPGDFRAFSMPSSISGRLTYHQRRYSMFQKIMLTENTSDKTRSHLIIDKFEMASSLAKDGPANAEGVCSDAEPAPRSRGRSLERLINGQEHIYEMSSRIVPLTGCWVAHLLSRPLRYKPA